MRAVYGIPPEQVVGTAAGTKYEYRKDGKPFLTKEPKLSSTTTVPGNRKGIHLMIGRRPMPRSGTRPVIGKCWSGPVPA